MEDLIPFNLELHEMAIDTFVENCGAVLMDLAASNAKCHRVTTHSLRYWLAFRSICA